MIEKHEILTVAKKARLEPSTIEKDYVLGWLLKSIYSHPLIKNIWIFKGGTALKKCYFKNYRFSEDLDFSLLSSVIDLDLLRKILTEVAAWIYNKSGIEIPISKITIDLYKNPLGLDALQAKICYNGPLKRKTNFPRVKLDLSLHEKIVLVPESRSIDHSYSDFYIEEDVKALCYPIEELFAEKIRALSERGRPRDVYDVVHLYKAREKLKNRQLLLKILSEKCQFKGLSLPNLQSISERINMSVISAEWSKMLAHQLPDLETFEEFWSQVPTIFSWLYQKDK